MKFLHLSALLCAAVSTQLQAAKIIPNHDIANLVLGQPNFTSGGSVNPFTSFRMAFPVSVIVDPVTGKVFVGDGDGDRILRYANAASLANGAPAEAVFGAETFSDGTGGSNQTRFFDSNALCLDRYGRLWVADPQNNRVLCFEAAAFRGDLPSADLVYGQPNFTTVTSSTTASKMKEPSGVWVDSSDNLWVADSGNNRVLKFSSITTKSSGASADSVLGQSNFTNGTAGSGNTGLQNPVSLTVSSGGTLYVACANADRVMVFNNAAGLGTNPPASKVLGQPDFATTTSGLSSSKFSFPTGCSVTSDDSLWVTDSANHRLVRFSTVSTKASGAAADGVVGQASFSSSTSGVTSQALSSPSGAPFVDAAGSLWIADTGNNRVLRFPADVTKPLLAVTPAVPATSTKSKVTIKGTASDAFGISRVQYKIGNGALKTATGTTSWQFKAPLVSGKNTITIFAVDSVGNQSISKVIKIKRKSKSSAAPFSLAAIK